MRRRFLIAVTNMTNTITFILDGAEYKAIKGMTWEEFINSEYNNDFFIKVDNRVYTRMTGQAVLYAAIGNDISVSVSDVIIKNYVYYKSHYGGAG